MSDNKKYYWLKLKDDFFDDLTIKMIEEMDNGINYTNFILKLYLKSVKAEGKLLFRGTMPYDEKMLSILTGVNIDIVRTALKLMLDFGMIERWDDGTLYISEVQSMIGSETESARRVRKHRQEQKTLHCNSDVIKCNTEIDIEKETEIDIEIEKKTNAQIAQGDLFYSETTPVSTDINNDDIFEVWWSEYDKKVDKKKCYNKWSKHISKKLYNVIIEHTKDYVRSTPDVRYRKAPLTYLNGANWEDDIQPHKSQKIGTQFSAKNNQDSEDYGF